PSSGPPAAAGPTPGPATEAAWRAPDTTGPSAAQTGGAPIPRLGRPVHMSGDRDRDAFLASVQWRPNDSVEAYVDVLYTDAHRTNQRLDMNLVGRNGAIIPLDMQLDANNVVTSATFTNAQFFLEARPYV